jgi:hypothetical protein
MKSLFGVLMMLCVSVGWGAEQSEPERASVVIGEVISTMASGGYTYLFLKTGNGEVWAAVNEAPIKVGDKVTIENAVEMGNFHSPSLKKDFDSIIFGNLAGEADAVVAAHVAAHTGAATKAEPTLGEKVPKASGPDARTVEEVLTKSAELKDKTVQVRGKVVKYSASVMGKNWIHLRDGSGSETNHTNDVLVTTTGKAKVGDVIVVKGTVSIDRDFGAGYSYKVLIENATLQL